jgi:hypothetical protein
MIITSSIKFPGDNVWFKKSGKFEVAFSKPVFKYLFCSAKIDVVVLNSEAIESGRYHVEESDSFVVKHRRIRILCPASIKSHAGCS